MDVMPEPMLPLGHRQDSPDVTAPDGSEIRFLVDRHHGAQGASVVEVTLPAGQVSRPVRHRTVEEVWYILEGAGRVWRCPPDAEPDAGSNETMIAPVTPGDALTIPAGWRFQFSASAAGPLRFLCVTMPPWPGADEAQPADSGGLGPATV